MKKVSYKGMPESENTNEKDEVLVEQVRELTRLEDRGTADILGERRRLSEPMSASDASRRMFLRSLGGFLTAGMVGWTGFLGWRWMSDETKTALLRRTLEFNERVSQIFYKPERLAPEFTRADITTARINGDAGMTSEFDSAAWTLSVGGLAGRTDDLRLTIEDIKKLPRTDMIVEFKCIEGWSMIAHYAGVRFSDFVGAYPPSSFESTRTDGKPKDLPPYVSMTTPDGGYWVGWDIESIMHPQTLLCYEMNGMPLTLAHGAPLRLASPTKYGIKQIKRIGRIEFTPVRPRDFWAENGYDWYAGL